MSGSDDETISGPGDDPTRARGDTSDDPTMVPGADDDGAPDYGSTLPRPGSFPGYRVLGTLGEGGMGVVYEAEQQEPRRRVAIKVMRGHAVSDELHLRLFRREVASLARLRHPNIGAIYESGNTADGAPFFAMELVEGQTLDRYLQSRPAPTTHEEVEHRLRLFNKVVGAVHYAHQRGVIHRDLKPGNVVITEHGSASGSESSMSPLPEVKVLDFGLARLADAENEGTVMTEVGAVRGTLQYMSPEQARGQSDEIDVRTDVYALGIVLYEMLAGARPYDVKRAAFAEAVRVICEQAPRPLRDTESGIRRLDVDLETIVFKALEKDADRRYVSAAALGEDVERYLGSQPILARPPSAAYQLRKLIGRHRAAAAVAGLLLLVIVAASVVSTSLYLRAEREAERARTEAGKSEQVAYFLQEMLAGVSPSIARGEDTTLLRQILETTAGRVDEELADQPEVATAIRQTLGRTYQQIGDLDLAEATLRQTLASLRATNPGDSDVVAGELYQLGVILWNRGTLDEAQEILGEAIEMQRRLYGEEDGELLSGLLVGLGNVKVSAGDHDGAEPLLRDGLAMRRRLTGDEDHAELAVGLNSLANLLHHRAEFEEAEALYREALAMHRRTLGDDHPDVVIDLTNLGFVMTSRGDFENAESTIREAVAISSRLYEGDHPNHASTLMHLADTLRVRGSWAEAESLHREVLAMRTRLHGEQSAEVAKAMTALASSIRYTRGPEAMLPLLREAVAIERRVLGDDNISVSTSLGGLGSALISLGRYEEAESVLDEALTIVVQQHGNAHPSAQVVRGNLSRIYQQTGRLDEAADIARDAIEGQRENFGDDHEQVAVAHVQLAVIELSRANLAAGLETLGHAMDAYRGSIGDDHPGTAVTRSMVGYLTLLEGDPSAGLAELRGAHATIAKFYGAEHKRTLQSAAPLAWGLAKNGLDREGLELIEPIFGREEGLTGGALADARGAYGLLLAVNGRFGDGERELLAAEKALRAASDFRAAPRRAMVHSGLVELYERWEQAEPGTGRGARADRWRR
ncbi:hypothetical protein ABI59_09765 [Acidobacteria bacterium Mor1]|nr:hypothetical protein ABI59_09765 [Acidobacteria bacterium Mor1]